MTMPQVIMLTHAAQVNRERVKIRSNQESDERTAAPHAVDTDMPMFKGKPIDQLTSEEYTQYLMEG